MWNVAAEGYLEVARGLLEVRLERPVGLSSVQRLSGERRRNLVLRLGLSGQGVPSSVILKRAEMGGAVDEATWNRNRFACDWAGAQFLTELGGSLAPRFFGGSAAQHFILLEDLGETHTSLVEPLLEGPPARAAALLERYAMLLGRLHAGSYGHLARYAALLDEVQPGLSPVWLSDFRTDPPALTEALALLEQHGGGAPRADLEAEVEGLRAELRREDFLVYLRGDGCPDNVFDTPAGLRLIDFEFGRYGHALLDACYPRMSMPTCWCAGRLPLEQVEAFEAVYRRELARRCPAARDGERFQRALAAACAFSLLLTIGWRLRRALEADSQAREDLPSLRSHLLAQCSGFLEVAEAPTQLPTLTRSVAHLRNALAQHWPGAAPAETYPAFRERR
jgi:hypothetical protein